MEYFIAISGAICIYALARLLIRPSGREVVQDRVSKYMIADLRQQVEAQAVSDREERGKNLGSNLRFISKDFADQIAASGVKLSPTEFFYAWIGCSLFPMALFALINGHVLSVAVAGLIGMFIPPLLLRRAIRKRQELFARQLSEALVIIGNGLKAGFSFQQAMDSVAKEMSPPLSTEFEKTMREIRYGLPMQDALRHMMDRAKSSDLDLFVSAVLTSAQVGSNLTDILDTIAGTIKDRIRIKQEVRVLTSQGRISGIIIGLLPLFLVLALMLLNPSYFGNFFETTLGKIMVAVSILLEIIGFSVIRKIADIKY